ncbi:hypothetical protein [Candidatus Pristimantibacillus sp. PTI5]|uniref:hypothetical protein n=1 Tax=Candidatus Pristimantibacillus sp. PTI5 TaxID=3400422 RepID=UPI003B01E781
MKKKMMTLMAATILTLTMGQNVFAGTSVDFYEFTINNSGNYVYGEFFTNNNSTPSISGWQDGACNNNTLVEYALVKKGILGDTKYAGPTAIPYDRITNWYTQQWYSVNTNTQMQIRIQNKADSCSTSGAGNVYN